MIHIVFQRPDTESLKKSFELDASLQGDIIQIEDDFAAGPLKDIFSTEGWEARREWWRAVLAGGGEQGREGGGGETGRRGPAARVSGKMGDVHREEVRVWVAPSNTTGSGLVDDI